MTERFDCRPRCGACCISPSISPCLPALPEGKAAGERCPHLTDENACKLFGKPERPPVCSGLQPGPEMCGSSAEEALLTISTWERLTTPVGW